MYTVTVPANGYGYEFNEIGTKTKLREAEKLLSGTRQELAQAEKYRDKLKEENSDLKDLLKQTLEYVGRTADEYHQPLRAAGDKVALTFRLGSKPDVKLTITDDGGFKRVTASLEPKADPDEAVLAKLRTQYGGGSRHVLGTIRKAGLDITLKDQGQSETAASPRLKSVS